MEKLNIIDKDVEFDDGVHSVSVNVGLEGLDSKKIFVFQRQLQLFKNKMLTGNDQHFESIWINSLVGRITAYR